MYEALIYEWNAQMGFRYPATVRVAAGGTQLAGVALIGVEKKNQFTCLTRSKVPILTLAGVAHQ